MKLSIISLAGVIGVQAAAIKAKPSFPIKHFKDFVAFGDSYSSQAGAGGIPITFTGGHVWPGFVADSTRVTLYDFAVAGAVCSDVYKNPGSSNRSREIQDQIPAWLGTANATHLNAGTTVYSNWIGTNDLGYDGFLGASEPKGYNITSFVECNWDVMDVIYANGGRYFVVLNTAPLELTTLYAAIGENGVGNNHYWKNKESYNTTQLSRIMMEYTLLVNEALQYGIPYNLAVQDRWPGATVVLYDVHSLMVDMYNNPSAYFDTPANSTGSYRNCDVNNVCTNSTNAPDTFLWYDELHPTVRTEQWIAKSFVDIVQWGNSSYATYWSSKQNY